MARTAGRRALEVVAEAEVGAGVVEDAQVEESMQTGHQDLSSQTVLRISHLPLRPQLQLQRKFTSKRGIMASTPRTSTDEQMTCRLHRVWSIYDDVEDIIPSSVDLYR